ncbi:MAG: hypothetical protein E3J35_01265, partial [Methanomassiliicoccales archaeon]
MPMLEEAVDMKNTPENLRRLESVSIVIALLLMAGFIVNPTPVGAPPATGTLNITWENLAPDTNTYQGDVNLTVLWLALEAQDADITLESIQVDIYGFPPEGINRTFAWDDRNYDKEMSYAECVIGEDTSAPYVLPPLGQMRECTWPGIGRPVVIEQNRSRYFTIYLDLDFDPDQQLTDKDLRVCVNEGSITSSASTVVGLPACSRTIEINTRLFFDDMERGQGNWTFEGGDDGGIYPDGLWHLSQGEEDCINNVPRRLFFHSENTSWWYGRRFEWFGDWMCNYYTNRSEAPLQPTKNWGRLRTPWIDARKGTSLVMTVWHFLAREMYSGVDLARVFLSDGEGWHLISGERTTDDHWRKLILNLSEYAGKQVQLEFRFDTMDERNNLFFGWFIDDLSVHGEVMEHDIAVTEFNMESFVSLDPQSVTARVSNIGMNDEYNVEIDLTQDGAVVDQKIITYLASGDTTKVMLTWVPPGEGLYEICFKSVPVQGEIVLWNNYQCMSVNATSRTLTKVAVLRSYGTQGQGPKTTWDYLNAHWDGYGLDPVIIDYTSLDIYPITYEAIKDIEPDVLVLSGSGYYYREPIGTELDDSEIEAIEMWAKEGNGFVTIGTAFHTNVSNNNGLVGLVGIADQTYYHRGSSSFIQVDGKCIDHPIFTSVSNPFEKTFSRSMVPMNGLRWDSGDLDGGTMCALANDASVAIVVHKGAVMISSAADVVPNEDEKQLLYNAFVWSRYNVFDYDVKVSANAPRFVRPFDSASVTSIIKNVGRKDLSAVQVDFRVDGSVVDTRDIIDLLRAEQAYENFTWVPSLLGTYQICVFADIVGIADENPSNNEVCMPIEVTNDIPIQVYVLDSWGTDFSGEAPWDYLNENWINHGSARVYINYTRFNKETISYQDLVDSYADVLLISSSRSGNMDNPDAGGYHFTDSELNAIARYTQEGHGLVATGLTLDSEKLAEHGQVLGPMFGLKAKNLYYYLSGINNLHVINPSENHPLFNNIEVNYDTANGMTLTTAHAISWGPGSWEWFPEDWRPEHLAGGEYKAISYPTENATVITHDPGGYKAVYITNFVEKNSNVNDKQLLYNAMVWVGTGIDSPTDLWIYKDGSTLRLEWTEPTSARVQGYRIYRAMSVNGFDFNNSYDEVLAGTTQWIDPQPLVGIDPNDYFYLVRA